MAQLYKNDLPLLTAGSKSILVLTVSDYENIYQNGEGTNYDPGATYYILETGEIRRGNINYGGNLMVELTKVQYNTLVDEGEVTIDGATITYSDDTVYFVTDESSSGSLDAETLAAIESYKTRQAVLALSASVNYTVTPSDSGTPSNSKPVTYSNSSSGVVKNMEDQPLTVSLSRGKITINFQVLRDGVTTVGASGGYVIYRFYWSSVLSALRGYLSSDDEKELFDTHIATMTLSHNGQTQILPGNACFHGEPGAEYIAIPYVSIGGSSTATSITLLNLNYNFGYVLQVVSDGSFNGSTEAYTITVLDWTLNH